MFKKRRKGTEIFNINFHFLQMIFKKNDPYLCNPLKIFY